MNQNQTKVLGLDVGDKRIGVASYCSADQTIVPVNTVSRAQGRAEAFLLELLSKDRFDLIIAGTPLSGNNQETEQCDSVHQFCRRLAKRCDIKIEFQDEYLSSEEAKELLRIRGEPEKGVRESGVIDAVSAAVILQRYLARTGHPIAIRLRYRGKSL
jgi:putative Holliday junction resolvase